MLNSFQILLYRERKRERKNKFVKFEFSLRLIRLDRFDFSNCHAGVMNSQYHLLHAKRYLKASVASSIKHYYHHHHWYHHQKAPSLPPALLNNHQVLLTFRVSLPIFEEKRKEKTFLPSSRGVLFLFIFISLSLFPALALFPEISTICTFTPSLLLPPCLFHRCCTIFVSVARMQKACSFVLTLELSPFHPFHPSCLVFVIVIFVIVTLCSTCG